jgi:DNA-binding FrmR family transcriptional regulator
MKSWIVHVKPKEALTLEYDKQVVNRLKRIEGQIKGVLGMMEKGKDCRDIITQLSAARNAIDRTMAVIVSTNLEKCVRENVEHGEETEHLVNEAVELLIKSR